MADLSDIMLKMIGLIRHPESMEVRRAEWAWGPRKTAFEDETCVPGSPRSNSPSGRIATWDDGICIGKRLIALTLIFSLAFPHEVLAGWWPFGGSKSAEAEERRQATRQLEVPLLPMRGLDADALGVPVERSDAQPMAIPASPISSFPNSPASSTPRTETRSPDGDSSSSDGSPEVGAHEVIFHSRHPEEVVTPRSAHSPVTLSEATRSRKADDDGLFDDPSGSLRSARDDEKGGLFDDVENGEVKEEKPGLLSRAGACLRGAGNCLKGAWNWVRRKKGAEASDPSVIARDDAEKSVQPGEIVEIVDFDEDGAPIYGKTQTFRTAEELGAILNPDAQAPTQDEEARAKAFANWAAQQAEEALPAKPWAELTKWEKFKRTAYYGAVGAFSIGWAWAASQLATVPIALWAPHTFKGTTSRIVGTISGALFLIPGAKQTTAGFDYLAGHSSKCAGSEGWRPDDVNDQNKLGWKILEVAVGVSLVLIPAANWFTYSATFIDYGLCFLPFLGPMFLDACRKARDGIKTATQTLTKEGRKMRRERKQLKNHLKTVAANLKDMPLDELRALYQQRFGKSEVEDTEMQDIHDLEVHDDALAAENLKVLKAIYEKGTDDAPKPSKVSRAIRWASWAIFGVGSIVWRGGALTSAMTTLGNGFIATTGWGSVAAMGVIAQVLAPPLTLITAAFASQMLYGWAKDAYNYLAPAKKRSPFAPVSAPVKRAGSAGVATALSAYAALSNIVLSQGPDKSNIFNFLSFLAFSVESAAQPYGTMQSGYGDLIGPKAETREGMIDHLRSWLETVHDQVDHLPKETLYGISAYLNQEKAAVAV